MISGAIYVLVAVMWLVPDTRIETHLSRAHQTRRGTAPPP